MSLRAIRIELFKPSLMRGLTPTWTKKVVSLLLVRSNGYRRKQVTCFKFFVNSIDLFYGFNMVICLEDLFVDPQRPVDFTSGQLDVPIS